MVSYNMNITLQTPTKAIVTTDNHEEIQKLKTQCTYVKNNIKYLISKHKQNRWWKNKDIDGWENRLEELKADLFGSILMIDENDNFWIRPGYITHIEQIQYSIENNISYPDLKPISWLKKPDFNDYKYQTESVKNLIKIKHGNISLPTGTGKSHILLMAAKEMGLDTVIVTPSRSIFNELLNEFQKRLGKKYVGGYGDGKKDIKKRITIAIGKSLSNLKEGTEQYEFFKNKQVMMVDESHTFAANELEKVCHGVLSNVPYRFFVSATQTRGDGTEKLLHSIIGENVLSMSLQDAIEQKYLCPLKISILEVHSPSSLKKKDPLECKRVHFLYNIEIAKIYAKIANAGWHLKKQSTLILVEELRQIKMLSELLTVPFAYVHSASKKDAGKWGLETVKLQEQVDKFNKGEVIVLIGTSCISTGTNTYPTHNTMNWVGGSSEIKTKQGTMGRSTRKLEISKYSDLHSPKLFSRIYDIRVLNQPILENQLKKRIEFYQECGENVSYF